MTLQQTHTRIQFTGKHFITSLPGKKHKGKNRILLEFLPVQRIAFKPVKTRHIFQQDKSIGFNYELINSYGSDYFNIIYIEFNGRYLWTSRQAILRYGKIRTFTNNKLETQIFYKIDFFKPSKEIAVQEMNSINELTANEAKNEMKKIPGEIDLFEGTNNKKGN